MLEKRSLKIKLRKKEEKIKRKKDKSAAKKERKATKTLAIVLGKIIGIWMWKDIDKSMKNLFF